MSICCKNKQLLTTFKALKSTESSKVYTNKNLEAQIASEAKKLKAQPKMKLFIKKHVAIIYLY